MPSPKLKQIQGVWLPDYDDHFQAHLEKGPEFEGHGTYQYAKIQKALEITPRRVLALDIGAHVGLWSMVLASHFEQVIAYEPMAAHIACFTRNLEGKHNVELHTCALGQESGRMQIRRAGDNSGNAHMLWPGESGGAWVNVRRLDDGTFSNQIDLIKIDTEGYEVPIVLGGENTIRTHKPAIVVEQKPNNAERYSYRRTEAVDILQSWGAKIAWEKSGDFGLVW